MSVLGFGYGPFGLGPFGESMWARSVRYDALPALYREQDAAEGYPLRDYLAGVEGTTEDLRLALRAVPNLRDPDLCPGGEGGVPILLGATVLSLTDSSQRGVDGEVRSRGEFSSPTARFTSSDVGRYLRVRGPLGDRTARIVLVLNSSSCLTEPPLPLDAGPCRWEIRAVSPRLAGNTLVEVEGGLVEAIRPGWVLTDGSSQRAVLARLRYPNRDGASDPPVTRSGSDGTVVSGLFLAPSLVLRELDLGRQILLYLPTGAARFTVESVAPSGAARLAGVGGAPVSLAPVAATFSWAMMERAQLVIEGATTPAGVVEQRGADAVVSAGGVSVDVVAASGIFTAADAGKVLRLVYPAPTGSRSLLVVEVLTTTSVRARTVDGLSTGTGTALAWRLHTRALVDRDSPALVRVRPPSYLDAFAQDAGFTPDRRHSAPRQRARIRHIEAWAARAASPQGLVATGLIEGCRVAPTALYRVSLEWWASLPDEARLERSEWGPGRSGSSGALAAGPGGVSRFTDASALFAGTDVGRVLRVDGGSNERWLTIASVVDAHTVDLAEDAILPDSPVAWHVSRLYSRRPPLLPRFDDFDADLMEELIDGLPAQTTDLWSIDRWCWEEGTIDWVEVVVSAVVATPPAGFLVTVVGRADVVVAARSWRLIDSTGAAFYLETVPESVDPGDPSFSFRVLSVSTPALGTARLDYVCEPLRSADFAAASVVSVSIEFVGPFDSPRELEALDARVVAHLGQSAAAHEEILPVFTATAECGFDMVAAVES